MAGWWMRDGSRAIERWVWRDRESRPASWLNQSAYLEAEIFGARGFMTIAGDILDLMKRKRRLRLTGLDIAEILYWEDKTYRQRVATVCLMLYDQGSLARSGTGSLADPFTYSMRRDERSG